MSRSNGSKPLMRDFIGINGHTVQFKPELYRPVCGLVRDYHPVEWDLGEGHGGTAGVSARQERRGLEQGLWLVAREGLEHRRLPDV